MKKLLRRIGLLMSVFLCSVIIFSTANTYAASIGSRLETPEDGWERYNDTAKQIKYIGTGWGYSENVSGRYKGDGHHQLGPDISGKVMFKFLGTKLRLMSFVHNEGSFRFAKDVKVTIDGVDKHFNMNLDKQQEQTLVFETSGLENKVHTVEISTVARTETRGINIDSIDIDKDGELIDIDVPTNLKATPGDSQVTLKWDQIENAESYTVKYGTESGKYTETATATKDVYGNFVIPGLTNGTKYYFVVSAKVNGVDSEYSNEASATPQGGGGQTDPEQPTGNRAILVVTMTTGLEKEFDLSMKEVNDFIAWYEAKQAGSGSASYAINKHDNNKGPFSSRKDYMLYDRILTFEVSEYSK